MAGEGQWHAWLRRRAEPRLTEWSTSPVKRAADIICRPYTSGNEGPSDLQESRIHNDLHGFRTLLMQQLSGTRAYYEMPSASWSGALCWAILLAWLLSHVGALCAASSFIPYGADPPI